MNKSLKNRVITVTPDPIDIQGLKDSEIQENKDYRNSCLKKFNDSASIILQ